MEKLFKTIDYLLNDVNSQNITPNDLNLIKNALELSDTAINIKRFKDEYKNNAGTTKLLQQIDKKAEEIKQKITIKEQELESLSINKGSLTLEVLNNILNSLQEIKKDIESQNNQIIINFLGSRIHDYKRNLLVKNCIEALSTNSSEIPKYFGIPLAKEIKKDCEYELLPSIINRVYSVVSNKPLIDDLKKNIDTRLEQEELEHKLFFIREMTEKRPDMQTIIELSEEINKIDRNTSKLSEETNKLINEYDILQIQTAKQSNRLRNFFKNKNNNNPQDTIKTRLDEISKIKTSNKARRSFLANRIEEIHRIKIGIHPTINTILENEELVYMTNEELKERINIINNRINQLKNNYSYTQKETETLLKENAEAYVDIIQLLTAKEKNNLTPIICLYALKLLVASEESKTFFINSKYSTEQYKQISNQIILDTNKDFQERINQATDINEIMKQYPESNRVKIKSIKL